MAFNDDRNYFNQHCWVAVRSIDRPNQPIAMIALHAIYASWKLKAAILIGIPRMPFVKSKRVSLRECLEVKISPNWMIKIDRYDTISSLIDTIQMSIKYQISKSIRINNRILIILSNKKKRLQTKWQSVNCRSFDNWPKVLMMLDPGGHRNSIDITTSGKCETAITSNGDEERAYRSGLSNRRCCGFEPSIDLRN